MKKILQTCFLALLCLFGSPPSAQSKVAESPSEEPLHPSALHVSPHSGDTHRGGETLSDTLPQEFSLIDRYLDPGAGEGTLRLQPAPVTVFAHQLLEDQKNIPETSDTESLGSCVLDLESSTQAGEGMLYIEIDSPNPPDTLWVTIWEHLLEDSKAVTPGVSFPLIGEDGNFFEGSMKNRVFVCVLPDSIPQGFFSLKYRKSELVKHWYFSSDDRVRMRFDRSGGSVLFGGPQAEFYRAQYRLDQVLAEQKFNRGPVLRAGSSEGLFADSLSRDRYREAMARPDDLYVKLQVVVPQENGWEYLNTFLSEAPEDHPGWALLRSARGNLTDLEYRRLAARLKGEMLFDAVKSAQPITGILQDDPVKGQTLLDWAAALNAGAESESHPVLVQALSGLLLLNSRIMDQGFFEALGRYPTPLKDELIGYFILKNFNRLGDRLPEILDIGLARVSTPWIRDRLQTAREVSKGDFVSEGLFDPDGNSVDLAAYRGKTLLIHFWISGCKFCRDEFETVLKPLEAKLKDDPDILVVTVNGDPGTATWNKSLESGFYTSPGFLNLHGSREGGVLSRYRIQTYPQKIILGPDTKPRLQTITRLDADELASMLDSIQNKSQTQNAFSLSKTLPL